MEAITQTKTPTPKQKAMLNLLMIAIDQRRFKLPPFNLQAKGVIRLALHQNRMIKKTKIQGATGNDVDVMILKRKNDSLALHCLRCLFTSVSVSSVYRGSIRTKIKCNDCGFTMFQGAELWVS